LAIVAMVFISEAKLRTLFSRFKPVWSHLVHRFQLVLQFRYNINLQLLAIDEMSHLIQILFWALQ